MGKRGKGKRYVQEDSDEEEGSIGGALRQEMRGEQGFSRRDLFWGACCCCTILCVLAILGTVGFGLVLGVIGSVDDYRYCLDLTGDKVIPVNGDTDGVGWAAIIFDKKDTVCVEILTDNIGTVNRMHIHGPLDIADPMNKGPPFITFGDAPADFVPDSDNGRFYSVALNPGMCQNVGKSVLRQITNNPHLFYMDVHTSPGAFDDDPRGALRDQLGNECSRHL